MSTLQPNNTNEQNPSETKLQPQEETPPNHKRRNLIVLCVVILILLLGGLLWFYLATKSTNQTTPTKNVATNPPASEKPAEAPITCADAYRSFADREFGMAFCYPSEWGDATVRDAKVDPTDTGHRQSIVFSSNPLFSVGGTSDDWSTTAGRDVGCLEPNNQVIPLSDYDTSWHGLVGSGATVEFAMRSLPSPTGGYDSTETVSDLLHRGVCAQAHKTITGSRYRVAFAAFYRDFAEASGIVTPRLHMDNPTVLFSVAQRQQFDTLLASLVAY